MPSIEARTRSVFGHWAYPIIAETASSRTLTAADFGAVITNRGGGALAATLPDPCAEYKGCWVKFFQVVAGDLVIRAVSADKLVALNDAAATSITLGQANEEIGNGVTMICDGTSWLTQLHLGAEATTTTVGA